VTYSGCPPSGVGAKTSKVGLSEANAAQWCDNEVLGREEKGKGVLPEDLVIGHRPPCIPMADSLRVTRILAHHWQ
jgi:hypothetical protein